MPSLPPRLRKGACKVCILATNPACARAAKKAGADFIYVPVHNYRRGEALIGGQVSPTAEQAGYPKQCIPVLPIVNHEGDEAREGGFDVYKRVKQTLPCFVKILVKWCTVLRWVRRLKSDPIFP